MDLIKVGIIGSGSIAERHLYSFKLLPTVEVVGVSSRNEKTAKELLKKMNFTEDLFMDYEQLLKSDSDAVSVCLPNYMHKDVSIDLLNSGKHVIVEKPLAINVIEGYEMLDAAKTANKEIFYCENNLYAPAFNKAKEVINEGSLGQIYMGQGKEQHSGPHSAWFYKKDKAGGGVLIDLGIHEIACLVWLLDCEVIEVFCQIKTVIPNRGDFGKCEVEDNAVGILYFENGTEAIIGTSWCAPGGYNIRFELFGTEGQIKVAPTFSNLVSVYSERGYKYAVEKAGTTKGWTFPVPDETYSFGYPQEIKHFIDCIIENEKPLTDGAFGQKILNIVETMYRSAETREIEEVLE